MSIKTYVNIHDDIVKAYRFESIDKAYADLPRDWLVSLRIYLGQVSMRLLTFIDYKFSIKTEDSEEYNYNYHKPPFYLVRRCVAHHYPEAEIPPKDIIEIWSVKEFEIKFEENTDFNVVSEQEPENEAK